MTITYQQNPDSPKFDSRYPTGNRPSLGAIQIRGQVAHGNRITIKTNGAYGFGSTGPITLLKSTLLGSTLNNRWSSSDMVGTGTVNGGSSGFPYVISDSGMPYGRALRIGTSQSWATNNNSTTMDGQIIAVGTATSKMYAHFYSRSPATQQANALSLMQATASPTWQIKETWMLDGAAADSDTSKIDVYGNSYRAGTGTPNKWINGYDVTTNDTISPAPVSRSPDAYLASDGLSFNAAPLIQQRYFKFGTTFADIRIRNTIYGVGLASSYSLPSGNTSGASFYVASSTTVDRVHMLGYCSGFQVPDNAYLEHGDYYVAVGNGAPARVEITDSATYGSSTKISPCYIVSWSGTEILLEVHAGCFYGSSLSGLYLHVHDMDHNYIGYVQI